MTTKEYLDIKFTGYRKLSADKIVLESWIINDSGENIFISDFPTYLRGIKLEKIIRRINDRKNKNILFK